jgi:hypothetical protein
MHNSNTHAAHEHTKPAQALFVPGNLFDKYFIMFMFDHRPEKKGIITRWLHSFGAPMYKITAARQ